MDAFANTLLHVARLLQKNDNKANKQKNPQGGGKSDPTGAIIGFIIACIAIYFIYTSCCKEPVKTEPANSSTSARTRPPPANAADPEVKQALNGFIDRIKNNDLMLRDVNLDHLEVSDDDARNLADALKSNTNVQYIKLRYNNISDKGGAALKEALAVNSSVRRMSLAGNKYMDHDLQVQIEKLSLNPSHRGGLSASEKQERAQQQFGTADDMADALTGGLAAQMRWRKLRNFVKGAAQFKQAPSVKAAKAEKAAGAAEDAPAAAAAAEALPVAAGPAVVVSVAPEEPASEAAAVVAPVTPTAADVAARSPSKPVSVAPAAEAGGGAAVVVPVTPTAADVAARADKEDAVVVPVAAEAAAEEAAAEVPAADSTKSYAAIVVGDVFGALQQRW